MEAKIVTRDEFMQRYWVYYLMLEKDFLSTERFLSIDKLNFSAFSNEYIKQYQAICSEIDVIAKSYCKQLDNSFRGSNINSYCKCIIDNNHDFISRIVETNNKEIELTPWKDWTYTETIQSNGTSRIEAKNPEWWHKYNKIKHNRTTINNETGIPYYKLSNQKNVLDSLAALFQLEMYYYRLLWQKNFPNDPDMPGPSSNIFKIANWGNKWIMASTNMGYKII